MIGTLRTVVLDAPDARRLAAFYTALGGWTEQYADDDWITLETGDGWRIVLPLLGLAAAFADRSAAQVDGLDRGQGTDVGEGVTVNDEEVGVVAGV